MTFLQQIEAAAQKRAQDKQEAFDRLVNLVWLTRNFTADQHANAVIEVPPDEFLTDLEATGRDLDDLMHALAAKGA